MNGYQQNRSKRESGMRAGFTLVEILVAMSIIVVLIAILLPAIGGARRTARNAAVRVELASLEKALSDFRTRFGEEPPSRVLLFETGSGFTTSITGALTPVGSSTAIPAAEAEKLRNLTIAKLGKYWKQFDFAANRDINNDGTIQSDTEPLLLTGAECLTFFLGGMQAQDTTDPTQVTMIGFSSNAANPFYAGTGSPTTISNRDQSTRVGPFHEFQTSRLIDVDNDGMREYCDELPNLTCPILYVKARNRRYDPADMVVFGDGIRDLTTPYTQGAGGAPWKEQSFQLISPGFDRQYGIGGGYKSDGGLDNRAARQAETDNITNFSDGTLE